MAQVVHGLAGYDPRWERGTRGGRGDVYPDAAAFRNGQPSEMGSLACRAMIDFLSSGAAAAAAPWSRAGATPAPACR